MKTNDKANPGVQPSRPVLEAAIRVGALGLIIAWCFLIFRPFLPLVIWSVIIAVAIYPIFRSLVKRMKGRKTLVATLMVVVTIAVILVPSIMGIGSVIDTVKSLSQGLETGTLTVAPPEERVREWPLVGEQLFNIWSEASVNLENTLREYRDQVKRAMGWLLRSLATIGIDLLLTILALIIAGIWLVHAEKGERAAKTLFTHLIGDKGNEYIDMARDTIRSVVQGVILVALIQAVMAWLGFKLVGLPAAGIWALLIMLLAVVQIPTIIIMLPLIIYVFSFASTGTAVAFAIWGIIVGISDSFLKPLLLGRGLDIPMLVILIGAIGGMMLHGVIGLFVGAVVMALGYKLYLYWLNDLPAGEENIETKT